VPAGVNRRAWLRFATAIKPKHPGARTKFGDPSAGDPRSPLMRRREADRTEQQAKGLIGLKKQFPSWGKLLVCAVFIRWQAGVPVA
jgi:hypothetical protein